MILNIYEKLKKALPIFHRLLKQIQKNAFDKNSSKLSSMLMQLKIKNLLYKFPFYYFHFACINADKRKNYYSTCQRNYADLKGIFCTFLVKINLQIISCEAFHF